MPRIRSIKPEIWMSPQVMNLPKDARLLFIGLITQADDEGRGTADARRVKAAIFGGDDETSANVRRMLDEIAAQSLITLYHDEKHGDLYALPSWRQHQKIDRPGKSGYPPPPIPRALVDDSSSIRRGSEGSEGSLGGRDLQDQEGTRAKPVDNGDNSAPPPEPRARAIGGNGHDHAPETREIFDQQSPPEEPQSRRRKSAERRNGNFEEINQAVMKLLAAGVCRATDPAGVARLAHISVPQAETALRQLKDRGQIPARVAAA